MTTNTPSQAASIDTPEFWALLREREEGAMDEAHAEELEQAIIDHIDAKLAQAFNDGAIEGRIHQRGIDDARIHAAESRLAEIQRGVEGLQQLDWAYDGMEVAKGWDGDYLRRDEVIALLAPPIQSDTSGLPG